MCVDFKSDQSRLQFDQVACPVGASAATLRKQQKRLQTFFWLRKGRVGGGGCVIARGAESWKAFAGLSGRTPWKSQKAHKWDALSSNAA